MIRNKETFEQAENLRKRGFSYKEISKMVGAPPSTLSSWFSNKEWSEQVRETNEKRAARDNSKRISLLNKARTNQHKRLYAEAERSAVTEYKHYHTNPLFMAGIMLYLAEGDTKHPQLIRIATSQMEIQRIFVSFAEEFLGVPREKVRFWLLLYPELDVKTCLNVWSKTLNIPSTNFHKSQVIEGRSKKHRLQYGVGNTIIGSAVLKKKLMKWIELALHDLK